MVLADSLLGGITRCCGGLAKLSKKYCTNGFCGDEMNRVCEEFLDEILKKIEEYCLRGEKPSSIFCRASEVNGKIFDGLISEIENGITNRYPSISSVMLGNVVEELSLKLASDYKSGNLRSGFDNCELNKEASEVLDNFYHLLMEGDLVVHGGKILKQDVKVDPLSGKDVYIAIKNNSFGMCEGVITKEGSLYLTKCIHESLLNYLFACGVDLKGAVRVQEAAMIGMLNFSSFESYVAFADEFVCDKHLRLTESQAETMVNLYQTLKNNKLLKKPASFETILKASENLGWCMFDASKTRKSSDFNIVYAKENLMLLNQKFNYELGADGFFDDIVHEFRLIRQHEVMGSEEENC